MENSLRSGLESQLGSIPCPVEDTEDIFWLRESDDYQSRVSLGNALAARYRFKEAADAYKSALRIRADDWKLLYRLAGANLTLRRFDEAMEGYRRCLDAGADIKAIAYPVGIGCYLQKDYPPAAEWFSRCLPCGDETAIAVIYWHTLSCYRCRQNPALLKEYHTAMQVGHHTAYRLAVSVFCGETAWERAGSQVDSERDELHTVIALYGICGFLDLIGKKEESGKYLDMLLKHDSFWPCVAYLAAWSDSLQTPADGTAELRARREEEIKRG
jgi:tetratricopeptide (TPR) repeat protein